ncbi:hypothetical protein BU26DRAFT_123587 [Trematosphaeria pertusa]|uniref:Uncharacterized protein n=1 Tax=Trematosphaeria pertusa TaxID=390896 RepID=A0A6A6HY88_9PLEO|nr:uncharacterized protein BU26DRAFT_123587 [Trematosphaeria pertusa]KAF2242977.1 hypothetical protein BU26DRAFT_123587 [Trematosphaeria pertusa]
MVPGRHRDPKCWDVSLTGKIDARFGTPAFLWLRCESGADAFWPEDPWSRVGVARSMTRSSPPRRASLTGLRSVRRVNRDAESFGPSRWGCYGPRLRFAAENLGEEWNSEAMIEFREYPECLALEKKDNAICDCESQDCQSLSQERIMKGPVIAP